jgi:hypothetical protein
MDVADQLQEVGFFLNHNGLVAILKKVASSAMTAVVGPRISRKQGAHYPS